jgi:hypothetical protein
MHQALQAGSAGTGVVIISPTAVVVQFMLNRIDGPATGDVIISHTAGLAASQ